MADRPILFSAPMVRALLDDRKFQTRRIVNFAGIEKVVEFVKVATDKEGRPVYEMKDANGKHVARPVGKHSVDYQFSPRFAVGDRLYVREHWRTLHKLDCLKPIHLANDRSVITYVADPENRNELWSFGKHRQAMHMPRWASRITLPITNVRVEPLQDISDEDAIAEGITCENVIVGAHCAGGTHVEVTADRYYYSGCPDEGFETAVDAYHSLWDLINGDGAWDENPWVVAVTVDVIKQNIDEVR